MFSHRQLAGLTTIIKHSLLTGEPKTQVTTMVPKNKQTKKQQQQGSVPKKLAHWCPRLSLSLIYTTIGKNLLRAHGFHGDEHNAGNKYIHNGPSSLN